MIRLRASRNATTEAFRRRWPRLLRWGLFFTVGLIGHDLAAGKTYSIRELVKSDFYSEFECEVDLGRIEFAEEIEIDVELINATQSELDIVEVRPQCACTNVKIPMGKYGPGASIPVRATIHSQAHGPNLKYHQVIALAGPGTPMVRVMFIYEFKERVQFLSGLNSIDIIQSGGGGPLRVPVVIGTRVDAASFNIVAEPDGELRDLKIARPNPRSGDRAFVSFLPPLNDRFESSTYRLVVLDQRGEEISESTVSLRKRHRLDILPNVIVLSRKESESLYVGRLLLIDRDPPDDATPESWGLITEGQCADRACQIESRAVSGSVAKLDVSIEFADGESVDAPESGQIQIQVRSRRGSRVVDIPCQFHVK